MRVLCVTTGLPCGLRDAECEDKESRTVRRNIISKLPITKTLRNLRNLAKRKTYLQNLAEILFAKACENLYLRNLANLAIVKRNKRKTAKT